MRKYWTLFKILSSELFQYRANFLFQVVANALLVLTIIGIWYAVFDSREAIGEYTRETMIQYLIIAAALQSFLARRSQGDDVNDDINLGNLSFHLVRPLNVQLFWFMRELARGAIFLLLSLAQIVFLLFLFREFLNISFSVVSTLLFGVSVTLGFIVNYFIYHVVSLLAFWMEQTWGPRFVLSMLAEVASGVVVPLSLFPHLLQQIFLLLPFQYVIYVPVQIFLQEWTARESMLALAGGFLWLAVLIGASQIIWRKGIELYEAEGA